VHLRLAGHPARLAVVVAGGVFALVEEESSAVLPKARRS